MSAAAETGILAVTSRRFTWTAKDGFSYRLGDQRTHGLNRTRDGAMERIASERTLLDRRKKAFLEELLDADTVAMISLSHILFEDGAHVIHGRRFEIGPAVIGD